MASKAKAKKKGKKKVISMTLPLDLCSANDISVGFGTFEPIANLQGTMLTNADIAASAKTLAADSLCHLAEGWRYFASATHAFLSHSDGLAIHHAYYAELRAAFALFSASGIRIRFPSHEYVDNKGASKAPPWKSIPTHTIAWELWKDWGKSAFSDQLFFDDLKLHPLLSVRDLQQHLQNLSPAASFQAWGFDLVSLSKDHSARNVASYEPYWAKKPLTTMSDDDFLFVTELWQQLRPLGAGLQFETSLVHFLIDMFIAQQQALPGGFDAQAWYTNLANTLSQQTGIPTAELTQLLQNRPCSTRPFRFASEQLTTTKHVLSRALFLLRFASLSTHKSFGVSPATTGKRWMRNWLLHAGLWDEVAVPMPSDIWADFQDLPATASPGIPLPFNIFNVTGNRSTLGRLGRPDACLAWSLQL